jgi:hypothetical protein
VRRAAAWSITHQNARVPQGVAALYIASKADRHYLVRVAATEALDILILCRHSCYKDLFRAADVLIARIRPDYNPTNGNCVNLVMGFCESCAGGPVVVEGGKGAEAIGDPKESKEDKKEDKKDEKKDEDKKDGQ